MQNPSPRPHPAVARPARPFRLLRAFILPSGWFIILIGLTVWLATGVRYFTGAGLVWFAIAVGLTALVAAYSIHLFYRHTLGEARAEIAEQRVALHVKLPQLQAIWDQSPLSILLLEAGDAAVPVRIVDCNPRACEVHGYTREELIGQCIDILEATPWTHNQPNWIVQFREGKRYEGEAEHRRKDGTHFWAEYFTSLIIIDGREYVIGMDRDCTARKKVEAELVHAKDAAEAATRAKSEFLANMSHEIRTPMNGVIGMTGLLLDTKLDELQREFAETIRTSADTLLTVINDILDFSKIEAGKLHFEDLEFSLVDVVEGTLEMLAERAQHKDIELISSIPPDVPPLLRGDPGRLRQVLVNLIGNAVKFTERGEVLVQVRVEAETATHVTIRFSVRDTGIGIAEDVQQRLFQAFTQADTSTTRRYGGTGLGLAIARQIVAMMGGQIGVQSEIGKGATFWFTAVLAKETGPGRPEPVYNNLELFNLRVLVVDDNATNRQILRHQIVAWKMQKGSAAGGHEALANLRSAAVAGQPYDVALLDMQMPEMDGLALARAIKADPAIASTRLIILTSLGHTSSRAELKAIGIDAYLVKPVKQSRLFDCLVDVMSQARAENIRANPASVPSPPVPPGTLSRVKILLAEDNAVNQKVALGQFKKLGYTADAVGNGLEALEALRAVPYEVVFMDCQMPEMDGYEATRAIRQREAASPGAGHVHIIAMTANAMAGDREKCLAAGMDDYVSKPVREGDLRNALARWAAPRPTAPSPA